MLEMAIKTFKMDDYKDVFTKYSNYYEFVVHSYIEQAMANYIRPIVLNYHNHDSSFKETEEIYYEMTDTVVHKVKNTKKHFCWKVNFSELEKENIFYGFKAHKLIEVEPAFLINA